MQKTKMANYKHFMISIVLSVVFTVLRTILLSFNYDFSTGFFENKLLATFYYVFIIIASFYFYFSKNKRCFCESAGVNTVFLILLALLFIALTFFTKTDIKFSTLLSKIIFYITFLSGVLSAIHYIILIFLKNNITKAFSNIFPTLFFISKSIELFMSESVAANTYNSFSNSIAFLSLAFIMLGEGKLLLNNSSFRLFSVSCITLFTVPQAVLPDIIFTIKEKIPFDFYSLILTLIQLVIVIYTLIKVLFYTKSLSEEKI